MNANGTNEYVKFSCNVLEKIIRNSISKPKGKISILEMKKLESLFGRYKCIKSIEGLEHAINLKTIDLSYCYIHDITPLMLLTKLETVILDGNKIKDISVLRNLKDIKKLSISLNEVGDFRPIADFRHLKTCCIHGNPIQSFFSFEENKTKIPYYKLIEKIGDSRLLTNRDNIYKFVYNPTIENAIEALRCSPKMHLFIGNVLDANMMKAIFIEILSNPKIHIQYVKDFAKIEVCGQSGEDFIADFGSNQAKKILMELILKNKNSLFQL